MLTSKRKEKISAFLDDDMHKDELMSFSLSAENEDTAQALRYQMVGDALRGEMSDNSFIDVSAAVREAVADEDLVFDTVSAYGGDKLADNQAINKPINKPVTSAAVSNWSLSSLFRPIAGMAVAASVAVVMVVSFNQQGGESGLAPIASVNDTKVIEQPVILANDGAGSKNNVENSVAVSNSGNNVDNNAGTDDEQKVNQRLVEQHLEFATQDTLQGRLPYVRAVSFEAEK